jgi:phosphatidylglycerophosphate synthase
VLLSRRIQVLAVHSITAIRAVAGFLFVALAAVPGKEVLAGTVYLLAIGGDVLDGYLARRFSVTSQFGAALDVIGDRLVTISSVVLFAASGFSAVACGLLLVRDTVISGLRVIHIDGAPLVRSSRKLGAPTALPIKLLTFAVLAYNSQGGVVFKASLTIGIWILAIFYFASLSVSIWLDRARIVRALYREGTEEI